MSKFGHLTWADKSLDYLEKESIEYIQSLSQSEKFFVGFSGVKTV